MEGAGGRKYPHVSFRAGDGRIKQVPLEHHVVAGVENHDDGGVFAALALVDGAGVGQLQFVEFVILVGDEFFVSSLAKTPQRGF